MDRKNILDLFKVDPGKTFSDLIATIVSHNGFMREKAVIRLGEMGNPDALPFLIERANDWVPQVRRAAYEAILRHRTPGNALAFVNALPALMHLENCIRADHSDLIAQVQDFLCAEPNRAVLLGQMSSNDAHVARLVCRLVVDRKLFGIEEMLARCLESKDVLVRSRASESLRELNLQAFDAVIDKALSDRFMPVRREAFQQLLLRDRPRGLAVGRAFLFDRSVALRELAVAHLLRDGVDVAAVYDNTLANTKHVRSLACIVWAWAELNRADRVDDLKRFAVHSSATIRRAAIQALAKLIGKDAEPYLVAGLSDKVRSVCTASSRLIVQLGIALSADKLISIARSSRTPATIGACCNIASFGNKWEWLLLVLELYGDEIEVATQDYLGIQLKDWNFKFNRAATQPSESQITSISRAARLCVPKIDKRLYSEISFAIKMYGGPVREP